MSRLSGCLVLLLAAATAGAQIYPGGGYPYPGGGYPYPGGGYPYPGTGSPYPGGTPYPGTGYPGTTGTTQSPAGRNPQGTASKSAPLPSFRGRIRVIDSKTLTLGLDDDRAITFKVTDKTRFYKNGATLKTPTDFKPGDQVSVEGPEDMAGNMTAVNVYWERSAADAGADSTASKGDSVPDTWANNTPQQPSNNSGTEVAPPPAKQADDDPGRPILRRHGPADPSREQSAPVPSDAAAPQTSPASAAAPAQSASVAPASQASLSPTAPPLNRAPDAAGGVSSSPDRELTFGAYQKDPLIRKAADAAMDFTDSLPNYVCQEMVTRYTSDSTPANWQAQDIVTTEVVYENGQEQYKNITVGGKPFKGSMDDTGGAWSTGEFGTILVNLFNPGTAAQFRYAGDSRAGHVLAKKYDFSVAHENSHWTVNVASQQYVPGYTGSVWIDPATGRVLRLEMAAHGFPQGFPTDHVESATDYDYVRLGGVQQFLLPVHSETLTCETGSNQCDRNAIDFRNYRKFEGDSTITFGDAK
ncbi:MAG TPA: DUF5666 domain-containing protein [Bryobacteraceae bacterium]|nr:DUF5666 domain-containing protein [Bryobacteraceae bacterium]